MGYFTVVELFYPSTCVQDITMNYTGDKTTIIFCSAMNRVHEWDLSLSAFLQPTRLPLSLDQLLQAWFL
jgi:hypothetical protein